MQIKQALIYQVVNLPQPFVRISEPKKSSPLFSSFFTNSQWDARINFLFLVVVLATRCCLELIIIIMMKSDAKKSKLNKDGILKFPLRIFFRRHDS